MEQAAAPARNSRAKSWSLAALSLLLLILAFPNFDLSLLAWIGLVPLLLIIGTKSGPRHDFLLGWFVGSAFFYATCYWLTYSMIHYGGIPTWLAYLLLVPGAALLGLFPAAFALAQGRLMRRWGPKGLLAAPLMWVTLEWLRLSITGQLWNAVGYSQAFHVERIQLARWGGVYAVSFFIVVVNALIAFAILRRTSKAFIWCAILLVVTLGFLASLRAFRVHQANPNINISDSSHASVVVLQPNVPMEADKTEQQFADLLALHINESEQALARVRSSDRLLVIWPESPMNFTYGSDASLQERLTKFARDNHVSLLFNSQEASPHGGFYNSALLINEEGRLVSQYDKIRLMPFGEYVPLPTWLPGANRVGAIVGGFEPGTRYTLMSAAGLRLGTFICIESAYPWIARNLSHAGAEVLVNISNDGYLGRTAVMRQHLANAVFRAVENNRPVLRVTNTGITAQILRDGSIADVAPAFQVATRVWAVDSGSLPQTFYAKHGDLFVALCGLVSVVMLAASIKGAGITE
jgi:apolipoprotein N-acyltransferase